MRIVVAVYGHLANGAPTAQEGQADDEKRAPETTALCASISVMHGGPFEKRQRTAALHDADARIVGASTFPPGYGVRQSSAAFHAPTRSARRFQSHAAESLSLS